MECFSSNRSNLQVAKSKLAKEQKIVIMMQRKVMKQQKLKKNERKYKLTLFECVLPFCAIGGLRVKSCSAYHLNQSSSSLKFFDAFCQFQRLQTLIFHEIFSMPCMLFLSCELLISLHSLQNYTKRFHVCGQYDGHESFHKLHLGVSKKELGSEGSREQKAPYKQLHMFHKVNSYYDEVC